MNILRPRARPLVTSTRFRRPGSDPDADAYFVRAGVTALRQRLAWTAFVRELKSLGVYDDIVEMWSFRSSQNAGSGLTIHGFKGVANGTRSGGAAWVAGNAPMLFPANSSAAISIPGVELGANCGWLWHSSGMFTPGDFANPAIVAHFGWNSNGRGWQALSSFVMARANGSPRVDSGAVTNGPEVRYLEVKNGGVALSDYSGFDGAAPITGWNGTPSWSSSAVNSTVVIGGAPQSQPFEHSFGALFKAPVASKYLQIRSLYQSTLGAV
jgi:hypothetical protein